MKTTEFHSFLNEAETVVYSLPHLPLFQRAGERHTYVVYGRASAPPLFTR